MARLQLGLQFQKKTIKNNTHILLTQFDEFSNLTINK